MKHNITDLGIPAESELRGIGIIGAAFTAIVKSMVTELINPVIGLFIGGVDFVNLFIGDLCITPVFMNIHNFTQ